MLSHHRDYFGIEKKHSTEVTLTLGFQRCTPHQGTSAQRVLISCTAAFHKKDSLHLGLENILLTAAAVDSSHWGQWHQVPWRLCCWHEQLCQNRSETLRKSVHWGTSEERKNGTHKRSVCVGWASKEKQIYPTRLHQWISSVLEEKVILKGCAIQ